MNNLEGSKSYISIAPSNHPANAKISYKDGNPVINFVIGEQERYLIGDSLRITGEITIYSAPDGDVGTPVQFEQAVNVSPKLSTYGILDQVVLSSQKSKNVIESVRHYGRYLASFLPVLHSKEEMMGHLGVTANIMPNSYANQIQYVANANGSSATNREYRGNSFCLALPTGFLSGGSQIGLSGKGWGVGGLSVDLHLSSDAQFLNASRTLFPNAFYQLTNVNLIAELRNPSVDELSRLAGQTSSVMEYNAISSYFSQIASSNAVVNFRLGLSRVLGGFMTFIPSEMLNNIKYDSFQTTPLINNLSAGEIAPIKQIILTKGGERMPFMYNLDTNVRDNANSIIADPQIVRNYISAFDKFMEVDSTMQTPITNNREGFSSMSNFADAGLQFGIGFSYNDLGTGIDMRTENFGLQMDTGLTSGLSHAVFLFVRSKQTLVMNANGVQVIS
tara:strand:- start:988 stop:2328 length:1341 start_codon:yes stop_codon:yes gene_type:complete